MNAIEYNGTYRCMNLTILGNGLSYGLVIT